MIKVTVVAPYELWAQAFGMLGSVSRHIDLWFRQDAPTEIRTYELLPNDSGIINHQIRLLTDDPVSAEIAVILKQLRTKWPYVLAEKQPLSWLETVSTRKGVAHA
jgi:hypothetical protein